MTSRTPDSSGTPPDPQSPDPDESSLETIDNSLLRVLVSDRWFRLAAVAVTFFVAAVILVVVPLFVVSTPEKKI